MALSPSALREVVARSTGRPVDWAAEVEKALEELNGWVRLDE